MATNDLFTWVKQLDSLVTIWNNSEDLLVYKIALTGTFSRSVERGGVSALHQLSL